MEKTELGDSGQGYTPCKAGASLELQTLGLGPPHSCPERFWHTRVPQMTPCPSSVPTVSCTGLYFNFRCTHVSDIYMYEHNYAASSVHCFEELQGIRYMAICWTPGDIPEVQDYTWRVPASETRNLFESLGLVDTNYIAWINNKILL